MQFRPFPILTVLSLLSLVILTMLGNWQWERYQEKLGLSAVEPPVPFEEVTAFPIAVEGGEAQLVYGLMDSLSVWRRYVPAQLADDLDTVVLVLRDVQVGIAPEPLALNDLTPITLTARQFSPIVETNRFAAPDRPEENTWYQRDVVAILANMGFEGSDVIEPEYVTIAHPDLGPRRIINPYAADKPIDPLPPERHFGYALTWWGLALGLIAVYFVFHLSQGRLKFDKE